MAIINLGQKHCILSRLFANDVQRVIVIMKVRCYSCLELLEYAEDCFTCLLTRAMPVPPVQRVMNPQDRTAIPRLLVGDAGMRTGT